MKKAQNFKDRFKRVKKGKKTKNGPKDLTGLKKQREHHKQN